MLHYGKEWPVFPDTGTIIVPLWVGRGFLPIYDSVTSYSQSQQLTTNTDICHLTQLLWVRNLGFWLRVSHEVALQMLAGAVSSESLTGDGRVTSKMAPSHAWCVHAGYWQWTLLPFHEGLSRRLLESLQNMTAASPEGEI